MAFMSTLQAKRDAKRQRIRERAAKREAARQARPLTKEDRAAIRLRHAARAKKRAHGQRIAALLADPDFTQPSTDAAREEWRAWYASLDVEYMKIVRYYEKVHYEKAE